TSLPPGALRSRRVAQPRKKPRRMREVTARALVAMSHPPCSGTTDPPSAAHDAWIEMFREQLEQELHPFELREALALVVQQVEPIELLQRAPEQAFAEPLVGQHTPEEALHRLLRHRLLHAPPRRYAERGPVVPRPSAPGANVRKYRRKL